MKTIICLFSLVLFISASVGLPAQDLREIVKAVQNVNSTMLVDQEDAYLTFEQIVTKYGYKAERHTVTTEDGYVLTIHRIQSPKCTQPNKPAIFLQHGLLSSSIDWIIIGPGNAIAYLLADCCYDVWLGNFRGNIHSRKHVSLNPDKEKFWEFSWHEMAKYDLPSSIKYVLDTTKQTELSYIGHSQGTTTFLIFCGLHPQLSKKVNAFIALAPIAFFEYTSSLLLNTMSLSWPMIDWVADIFGLKEFAPLSAELAELGGRLCHEQSKVSFLCANVLFILCGWNTELFNPALMPILMGHSPAGSSTKQLIHYAQNMGSDQFRQYDYTVANLWYYGSIFPPKYDLSKVNVPCYFIYSENDNFATTRDVLKLWNFIPKAYKAELYKVPFAKFNHLDYMFAIDVKKYVYDKVLDIVGKKSGNTCCNCEKN